jgi:hypothetical protein
VQEKGGAKRCERTDMPFTRKIERRPRRRVRAEREGAENERGLRNLGRRRTFGEEGEVGTIQLLCTLTDSR